MALSSRRSGGGVPLFLNAVATATNNRASVVLRAQPKQPLFRPRDNRRSGRGRGSSSTSRSGATDGGETQALGAPSHLVRLATREDLPALAAIERACGHYEWGPEALKHELESPLATLLVAEVKGEEERRTFGETLPSSSSSSSTFAAATGAAAADKENEGQPRSSSPSSLPAPSSSPISGLAIVWNVADETQILELAVHPSRRRRGAAKALMSAALASSPAAAAAAAAAASSSSSPSQGFSDGGGGRAVLEVASRNVGAVSLYASFGFEVDGVRKGTTGTGTTRC